MSEVKGNLVGLKPNQKKSLQKLFQKKVHKESIVSLDLAKSLTEISHETGRQTALLIDRRGNILEVLVGDSKGILISELGRFRVGKSRFRGVRLIHTHLTNEPLTQDDLTDLALLRFDAIAAIETKPDGYPGLIHMAWLVPPQPSSGKNSHPQTPWHIEPPISVYDLDLDFYSMIEALESEFAEADTLRGSSSEHDRRGILVGVTCGRLEDLQNSMEELKELADSAGIEVVEVITQRRTAINPKYVLGSGKIKDLMITALQGGVDLIVFEGELTGSQMRAIAELCELEVIDRTQLILDIFAKRAHSRDGKLQVELAQMKYSLPRLVLKDDFMSRITGGIGAKGPGETKLEVLRRRVRDRIAKLEKDLDNISKQRRLRRAQRKRSGIPVTSLIGYTNAGKSTILRALTAADVFIEHRMFATLDPTSRRLHLPSGSHTVLTDTVGFIQDLPKDLAKAFRATLEELEDADLLVHVVDISNPNFANQIMAVSEILEELALDSIPQILLFNKTDKIDKDTLTEYLETWPESVTCSGLDPKSMGPFLKAVDAFVNENFQNTTNSYVKDWENLDTLEVDENLLETSEDKLSDPDQISSDN